MPKGVFLDGRVLLHPGRPHRPIMLAVIERMLAHRDPPIVFTRLEDGGIPVPADHSAEMIVDAWDPCNVCGAGVFGVEANGRGNLLAIAPRNWAGHQQGRLSLYWQFDLTLTDGLVDLLADVSNLVSSPLSVLSHQHEDFRVWMGWEARVGSHRQAEREASSQPRQGLSAGLAGVAHRMILGDEVVAMLGEDRLASLPGEWAQRHKSGRWVLSPTVDPLEWTYERWCPGEAAIIEALGPRFFYDPVTKSLPTVVPDLPEVAPYPCRTRKPRTGECVEHNLTARPG